ncbi:hypothetical protein PRUPE_8G242200 [Prunus persica]|uniref:Uncharacterized protein n=1 Tax=Prunus persica TaxID=3760 RepID=A0A251N2P1_PRUPE|nr:hypothetical protein PRUPE_8G242200 [Prunus persica]
MKNKTKLPRFLTCLRKSRSSCTFKSGFVFFQTKLHNPKNVIGVWVCVYTESIGALKTGGFDILAWAKWDANIRC